MAVPQTTKLSATLDIQEIVPQQKEALLKRLLKKVTNLSPSKVLQQTQQTVDEVILEFDVEGMHYYLVRCKQREESQIILSPREKAIAKLVAQGLPNKCIGDELDISPWTVATHIRRIFAKLDVTSRSAMINKLHKENLLEE
jgi:two-component system nitrate/nitrite response regulator NarL